MLYNLIITVCPQLTPASRHDFSMDDATGFIVAVCPHFGVAASVFIGQFETTL
jgi:hypothetical protein